MTRIPQHFIDELIARTDIVEVLGNRIELKKKGSEYAASCPFHAEKTPSFYVSPRKQFYHCFGCGAHGTAISFLMEHDNMGFVDAVEELATRAGMEVPREPGQREENDLRQRLLDIQEAAARYFSEALRRDADAVAYLKNRGLSGEIARDYRLGFAPDRRDQLTQTLSTRFSESDLLTAGLSIRKDGGRPYDRFRGRIMFPIRDGQGRILGFGGRILGEGSPKYLNSPETPIFHKGRQLYGLHEARRSAPRLDRLLVVEGYMDVIALAQFGLHNVVATLGTATTREHLEQLFRVVAVPRLVFCFDGDRAGREAAWRALEQALPTLRDGREIRFLFLPEGDDPDSLVRREGIEGMQARLERAEPLSEFLIQVLRDRHDIDSREGRAALGAEATRLLEQLPESLLRSQIIGDLAPWTGVSAQRLEQQIQGRASPETSVRKPAAGRPTDRQRRLAVTPVRLALSLLLDQPGLAAGIRNTSWLADLDAQGVDLLLKILETLAAEPTLSSAQLLERWRDTEAGAHLMKLARWQPPIPEGVDPARMLEDALSRLRRQLDQQQAGQLLAKAAGEGLDESEKLRLKELVSGNSGS